VKEEFLIFMERVAIIFSTITGNAFKLASAVSEVVPDYVGPYNIRYVNDEVLEKFDTFILSYWCNHGTADDDTIALIQKMKGKNLIVIGTLGADRASKHAEDVCRNVSALASENNRLLGHFLCRGSVDLKRTARRLAIPEGEKGHLSQERFEKQKLSQGHPDEADLENARAAVKEFLEKL
jgi:flavodoxin family protein